MQCACCCQYPSPRYPFFPNRPISEPLRTKIYFPDSQVDISGVCLLEGSERRFNQDGSLLLRLFPTRLAPHQQFDTSNQTPASNTLVNRSEVRRQPTSNSRQVSVIKSTATVAPTDEPNTEKRTGSKRNSNLESLEERTYPSVNASKRLKTPEPLEEPTSQAVRDETEGMCTKSPILPDSNYIESKPCASPASCNESTSASASKCTQSSPVPFGKNLSKSSEFPREGVTQRNAPETHTFQGVNASVEPPRLSTSREEVSATQFNHDIVNSPDSDRALSVIKQMKQTPMAQNVRIPVFSFAPATAQQVERVYQQASMQQVNKVSPQDSVSTIVYQVERTYQQDTVKATKKAFKVKRKKIREKKPRRNYNRINAWNGPSYTDLITNAISSAANRKMIVAEIYDWLIQHVPYFNERQDCESSQGWKVKLILAENTVPGFAFH